MSKEKLKQVADNLERVWRRTFNAEHEPIHIEVHDDEICFGDYALVPKPIEVTKLSILGDATRTVNGWEVVAFINRYTPNEPDDIDEVPVSEHERVEDAIIALVDHIAHRKSRAVIEEINWEEYAEECNENQ